MKAAFPNAKDEHLDGKVFDAKDVMGILCDGEMMLGDVISRVFNLANGTEQPIARTTNRKLGQRQQPAGSASFAASKQANTLSTTLNSINMKEQFPAVFALLGVEEMQMQEGGAFMNEGLLATLNANIEAAQKEKADALALVESLTAEKNELTAKVEELTAQAETKEAEHAKAIEDMNAAHATAIEEKDNQISALEQEKADLQSDMEGKASQIETLTADLNGAKESLTTAESTIAERDATLAERDQQITDLNAQIAELQNDPGTGAQAGAAPQNNGGGAEAPQVAIGTQYAYDNSLSYEENMKRKKEWEAEHK
jgi:DNA repair exonuclease SbcCD ATPase subunit